MIAGQSSDLFRPDPGLADEPRTVRLAELRRRCSPDARVRVTVSQAVGELPPEARLSARSKLARLGLADDPTAYQWVAKRERVTDWNRIRTPAELRRAAAAEFGAASLEGRYLLEPDAAGGAALAHLAALRAAAVTNPAAAAALSVFEADPAGNWARVAAWLNRQRVQSVREWRTYLTEGNDEYAKDPFWQACVWQIVHEALNGGRNHGLGGVAPLHKGALAALRASLAYERSPVSFRRRYERLRAEYARMGGASLPAGGEREWVYIPSKTEARRRFSENVQRLQALSCPTWCTKSYNAERYLERGGFWLLMEGAAAIVAIRLVGRTVAELQGRRNDGAFPAEAAAAIDALLASRPELEGAALWRVRNPDATDERLAAIATGGPAEAGRLAARHPNAGPITLAALAAAEDAETRLAVAGRADTPVEALNLLAEGTDARVLTAVASHPNTPPETLAVLGTGTFNGVRAAAARHPATPAATLTALAADASKLVRGAVGGNPNTPPATLARLAVDEYYGVRGDVAGNPNTPCAVLANLLEDEHPYVRGRAGENPNAPRRSLSAAGVEAYYDPETDTSVFLLDRIESVERAGELFFHERSHRRIARLGRGAERRLAALEPRLLADAPALLEGSGYFSLASLKAAYGFDGSPAGRFALLDELLARRAERAARK